MNAKDELNAMLEGKAQMKCALVEFLRPAKTIGLRLGYSTDEKNDFFKVLDLDYDDGYGTQIITGIVWLDDNTWLSRREYDGSEWWVHNKLPEIPASLGGWVWCRASKLAPPPETHP